MSILATFNKADNEILASFIVPIYVLGTAVWPACVTLAIRITTEADINADYFHQPLEFGVAPSIPIPATSCSLDSQSAVHYRSLSLC